MRDFKKIIAWQKAHRLSVRIHQIAPDWNFASSPGLRSQLLRAIASVPGNISEGAGARTDAEFARYLDIAQKSARESENHLLHAAALGCMATTTGETVLEGLDEVKRVLYSYTRSVRKRAGLDDTRS
ncbi:MAG: ribosomal protein [Gemmatimonadetes bacterium]|nr:ribosomal protein [Gemmatimonadota bacterium]